MHLVNTTRDEIMYGLSDTEDVPYRPSATRGDYGASRPWDAPGMSVSDFI